MGSSQSKIQNPKSKMGFGLVLFCWLLFAGSVLAQTGLEDLTQAQIQALIAVKHNLATIDDLEARKVLSAETAEVQRAYYLAQAQAILAEPLEPNQLLSLLDQLAAAQADQSAGALGRIRGFFTFINIIWTLASLLLVGAAGWLIRLYLFPILKQVPAIIYEGLVYLACLAFIIAGGWFERGSDQFIALPGCLGFMGALAFSHRLHGDRLKAFFDKFQLDARTFYLYLIFFLWTGIAIAYQSVVIAFIAVMALEALLGFSVLMTPLCYAIGFQEKDVIPRALGASLILLVFYVLIEINGVTLPYFSIFSPGVLFMGSLVYFVGLLIASSKWYDHKNMPRYLGLQVLTIISGIVALFVGSVWQISQLQGIGGTFFFLYLLEKYFELPWSRKRWAWATLGLAVILYLLSLVISQYPQYFLLVA